MKELLEELQALMQKEANIIADIVKNCVDKNSLRYFEKIQGMVDVSNCKGVYVFYSKKGVRILDKEKFNDVKYGAKINIEKDLSKLYTIIYLGKSNDLKKRIEEHNGTTDALPYSLKKNNENRTELKDIEICIFRLKQEYEHYSNLILGAIESYLHQDLAPLVGSKRV